LSTPDPLHWSFLGRVDYAEALALQHRLRDEVQDGKRGATLLLLEHPPTITLGLRANESDLRASRAVLTDRGVALHYADRGGRATFHGPGQLVGYPIVSLPRLGLAVPEYVRALAEGVARVANAYGVDLVWSDERPGLWHDSGKVAAFGVHVTRGVTCHGFAFNVSPELDSFDLIVPCGHADAATTSLAAITGRTPALTDVAAETAVAVAAALGLRAVLVARRDVGGE